MIPYCILVIDADRDFMSSLFIEYQRLLYKEIYDILRNPWNTEDVLQETLVKLIERIPELRKKEQPTLVSYITVAARHTAYNFLRSQKKSTQLSMEDYLDQAASQDEWRQIETHLIQKEEIDKKRKLTSWCRIGLSLIVEVNIYWKEDTYSVKVMRSWLRNYQSNHQAFVWH